MKHPDACRSCGDYLTEKNTARKAPKGSRNFLDAVTICQTCSDRIEEEIEELEEEDAAVCAFTDYLREQNIEVVPGSGIWSSTIIDGLNNNRLGSDYQKWREWTIQFGLPEYLKRKKEYDERQKS